MIRLKRDVDYRTGTEGLQLPLRQSCPAALCSVSLAAACSASIVFSTLLQTLHARNQDTDLYSVQDCAAYATIQV